MNLSALLSCNFVNHSAYLTDLLSSSLCISCKECIESENDINLVSSLLYSHFHLLELYLKEAL